MKGRDRLFFNLLTFLLLVVIVLVAVKTRDADKQIKRWHADIEKRQQRGYQDPELKKQVDDLEAALRKRLEETFELDCDPLDLTRVIKTKKFLSKIGVETAETEGRLRLAATIIGGPTPSAVLKFQGRSRMVHPGDKLDDSGYRVVVIEKNRMLLKRGGEELWLKTEKAPDTLAELEALFPDGENLPKVEVKKVSSGNY